MGVFSAFVSSTKVLVSITKSGRLQQNKCVYLLFRSWFKPTKKEQKLGKKSSANFISSRDRPEKSTETRHECTNARRLPYICCVFLADVGCRVVFLFSFISCLVSIPFSGPSLLERKFCRNFLPSMMKLRIEHAVPEQA